MFELKVKKQSPIKVIAEIGANHQGDISIAHDMIRCVAQFCQVDYAKFQKRTVKELLTEEEYNRPYTSSFGKTYGEHRDFLEFDIEQHVTLKEWCEEEGIRYSCSVWDITAAKEVISLNPDYIKIPSAMNQNFPLLKYVFDNFSGQIHISLGMTSKEQLELLFDFLDDDVENSKWERFIPYHCTSSYPCTFEDINLFNLKSFFDMEFGFSGHHQGIAVDIAAMAFGATWIERHFTLDRTMRGTDHAASLEPDGMKRLVRDIEHVYKTFTRREGILPSEMESYKKLKKVVLE